MFPEALLLIVTLIFGAFCAIAVFVASKQRAIRLPKRAKAPAENGSFFMIDTP
jgi:hypothetical protein